MQKVNDRLYNWATDVEGSTINEALKTARLPIVTGHVALMPDAHVGFGSTVGSVIPTTDAIIPAAVGVDIGCGMIAVCTSLTAGGELRLGSGRVGRGAGSPVITATRSGGRR